LLWNPPGWHRDAYSGFAELSLPQFYQFLHEMEKAKASLDFFS
jgi:hypothetical protein